MATALAVPSHLPGVRHPSRPRTVPSFQLRPTTPIRNPQKEQQQQQTQPRSINNRDAHSVYRTPAGQSQLRMASSGETLKPVVLRQLGWFGGVVFFVGWFLALVGSINARADCSDAYDTKIQHMCESRARAFIWSEVYNLLVMLVILMAARGGSLWKTRIIFISMLTIATMFSLLRVEDGFRGQIEYRNYSYGSRGDFFVRYVAKGGFIVAAVGNLIMTLANFAAIAVVGLERQIEVEVPEQISLLGTRIERSFNAAKSAWVSADTLTARPPRTTGPAAQPGVIQVTCESDPIASP